LSLTPHQLRAYEVAVSHWRAAGPVSREAQHHLAELRAAREAGDTRREIASFKRFLRTLTSPQTRALGRLMTLIGEGYFPRSSRRGN
jgi:hypothetical protein